MTIDTTGKWWKGTDFSDVETYLRGLEPGGYPVDKIIAARCACGGATFSLNVDQDEELAQTTCTTCGRDAFVSDSEEHWSDAAPQAMKCPSMHSEFEVGLGLHLRDGEDGPWVRWMSLGTRCVHCGTLASPLDWKSDLDLTEPSATRIG